MELGDICVREKLRMDRFDFFNGFRISFEPRNEGRLRELFTTTHRQSCFNFGVTRKDSVFQPSTSIIASSSKIFSNRKTFSRSYRVKVSKNDRQLTK
mmetsp:Transcript_6969/g.16449  ORF Transcript_6969/g.16449 Transcript_6969/m.16449 type:complete len:97 (-) Transcript_6969:325-615(-)